jgi:hypothetical protein
MKFPIRDRDGEKDGILVESAFCWVTGIFVSIQRVVLTEEISRDFIENPQYFTMFRQMPFYNEISSTIQRSVHEISRNGYIIQNDYKFRVIF